jgi:hypothetical protein
MALRHFLKQSNFGLFLKHFLICFFFVIVNTFRTGMKLYSLFLEREWAQLHTLLT